MECLVEWFVAKLLTSLKFGELLDGNVECWRDWCRYRKAVLDGWIGAGENDLMRREWEVLRSVEGQKQLVCREDTWRQFWKQKNGKLYYVGIVVYFAVFRELEIQVRTDGFEVFDSWMEIVAQYSEEFNSIRVLEAQEIKYLNLEMDFFSEEKSQERGVLNLEEGIIVAIDFDKTLTMEDTSHILPHAVILKEKDSVLRSNKLCRWKHLEYIYSTRSEQIIRELLQNTPERNTLEVTHPIVEAFSKFEEDMADIVFNEFLSGLTSEDIFQEASKFDLSNFRLGVKETLEKLCEIAEVHIISVNWSIEFVQQVLMNFCDFSRIHFHGNCISTHIQSNDLCIKLRHWKDKLNAFDRLLPCSADHSTFRIYIGDSFNDLLAMRSANLAIMIDTGSATLQKFLDYFEISTKPLYILVQEISHRNMHMHVKDLLLRQKTIWTVKYWSEIYCLIQLFQLNLQDS